MVFGGILRTQTDQEIPYYRDSGSIGIDIPSTTPALKNGAIWIDTGFSRITYETQLL